MFKYEFKINFRLVSPALSGSSMPLKGISPSQRSSLLINESWPVVPFGPVTGDKLLLGFSFKCAWSAIKNVEDTFQNYVLRHLHQNKWADCLLCVWGRQIMQSPSFLNFIASLSLWPHKSAVILWVFIQNREESTERLIGSSGQMRHSRKTGIYTHHTFHSSIKSWSALP